MARPTFDRLAHLRKRAHSLRNGLLARLSEYASDFPSGAPKETIELIKQILVSTATQIELSTDERFLAQTCWSIQRIGSYLTFFDNAHTAQTPRGLTEMVGHIMAQLQPGSRYMVWPQADFNYSIRDFLPKLKALTQYLLPADVFQRIFSSFNGPLNLISFPRVERDNVLLHATFGHELGHPIADKFLASEKGTKKYADDLYRAVQQLPGSGGNAAALNTLAPEINRLLQLRNRGLQELISDCVGTLLFGYSAILAAYDVLTINAIDSPPDDYYMYPPRRFRLRLQCEIASRTGHANAIRTLGRRGVDKILVNSAKDFLSHLDDLIGQKEDLVGLKKDQVISIAYEWIDATLEDAILFAIKEIGDVAYRVKKVEDEVPELIRRIDLSLPPNEIGRWPRMEPVDWRSAILAAWLYRVHGKKLSGIDKGRSMTVVEFEKLNRLTLKAIEYTTLQKQYSTYIHERQVGS